MSLIQISAISNNDTFNLPAISPTVIYGQLPNLVWDEISASKPARFTGYKNSGGAVSTFDTNYSIIIKSVSFSIPNLPGLSLIKFHDDGVITKKNHYIRINIKKVSDDALLDSFSLSFSEYDTKTNINLNYNSNVANERFYIEVNSPSELYYDPRNVLDIYDGIEIFEQVELEIDTIEY